MENQVYKVTTIDSCVDYKEIVFVLAKDVKDNVISVCNFENIYPISLEQKELLVFPTQTLTDKAFWLMREYAIETVKQLNYNGIIVVKMALKPKQIQDQNKFEDDDIKVLEVICGKSDYIDYAKNSVKYQFERIGVALQKGEALDQIKIDKMDRLIACFEPRIKEVVMIDVSSNNIEKSPSVAGCIQKLHLSNILTKSIENFYKKELNRIEDLKLHLEKADFLDVWDIKEAKKYGFTNEEIADLSKESLKEIDAICIGNNII